MYKALIVDDEKPVRQVIQALGLWEKNGIGQVFEALEGESALRVMREENPDIVFLDMNMPNMDGVAFLKVACEEFPKTKYIVVSGYEDFEYTKQAIHSKVLDYLLKPVVEDELNRVLKRAVRELAEERAQEFEGLRRRIEQNVTIPLAREKIIIQLIEGLGHNPLTEEQKKILRISEEYSYYGITVFSLLNFESVCGRVFRGDAHAACFAITNVMNELASSWCNGFSFKDVRTRNEIIFTIMASTREEKEFDRLLPGRIHEIIAKLEELFGIYSIAAIGKEVSEAASLKVSYKTALELLHSTNILKSSERVLTKPGPVMKSKRASLMEKKEVFIYAFETGNVEYAVSIMRQHFESIRRQGCWSWDDQYTTTMEFMLILENITEQFGVDEEKNILSEFTYKNLEGSFKKLEDYEEFILDFVKSIFASARTSMKASEKESLYEIKDYIDNNYVREIKLSDFSGKYYRRKEYLSRQFKEEFGYGIYEYVLKVRMEKAAEMISDLSVKIQTVSEHLGYKDNNYFSRAFKAYFGMSPSEYRELKTKK